MVKTDSGDSKSPAITSSLFLTSVKSWYNDDGIPLIIDNVGGVNPNPNNDAGQESSVKLVRL